MSFFIVFTIAIRPVLPLVNYVVNYDYIAKDLCENRTVENSYCKGKCYVAKEFSKTEKQNNNNQNIKIAGLDAFVSSDIFTCSNVQYFELSVKNLFSSGNRFYDSEYFSRIFHPPLG